MEALGPIVGDCCLACGVRRQSAECEGVRGQGLCHDGETGLRPTGRGALARALGRGLDGEASGSETPSSSRAEEGGRESERPARGLIINAGKT